MTALPEISSALVAAWVTQYAGPFMRISAFLMSAPLIGTRMVPMRVRLFLALALTMLVGREHVGIMLDPVSLPMLELVACELLTGIMLGFSMQLFFQIPVLAGQVVSTQAGLGFASMIDPANGVSVAVIGQFFSIFFALVFLALNGHLAMAGVILHSFQLLPTGEWIASLSLQRLVIFASWLFSASLLVSLPALMALLIVNMALGVMSRASPQLNIFSVGFPFTLLFGLAIVWSSLSMVQPAIERYLDENMAMTLSLLKGDDHVR